MALYALDDALASSGTCEFTLRRFLRNLYARSLPDFADLAARAGKADGDRALFVAMTQ